ncbi:hypothetical protein CYMTET_49998 [Cymbomonas tetramitiformis]|uniref:Uncharacterized protein n=1 Tax=Cymbomonas tetramitiformis TaxID=36881 RepID=A0AAE0EU54_9CHLO|nr:hypothetical protein CYMTET_49998 [Cymbomonas tetramitiformis]
MDTWIRVSEGSQVTYNWAWEYGGGLMSWGENVTMHIQSGGGVSANSAPTGAGVFFQDRIKLLVETGGSVSYNQAYRYGGGIYGAGHGNVVSLSEGALSWNLAGNSGGGGMFLEKVSVLMRASEMTGNSAASGGGLYCTLGGTLDIVDSVMSQNDAEMGGGAVYMDMPFNEQASAVRFHGSLLADNRARRYNGGALLANIGSEVTITGGSLFARNSAAQGGALWAHRSVVVAENSTFVNNSADFHGGALSLSLANFTMRDSLVQGSFTVLSGGGIHAAASTGILERLRLVANRAITQGGGMHLTSGSIVELAQVLVQGSLASKGGGIVVDERSTMSLEASALLGNAAEGAGQACGVGGGALLLTDAHVALVMCNVADNKAMELDMVGGGAVQGGGTVLEVMDVAWDGNEADLGGGALILLADADTLTMTRARFTNCRAFVGGGIMLQWPSKLTNLKLADLHFDNFNINGSLGQNIYWEVEDLAMAQGNEPVCVNCTAAGVTELFTTNGISASLNQSNGGEVTTVLVASGTAVDPALTYSMLDYYGNPAPVPAESRFTIVRVWAYPHVAPDHEDDWSLSGDLVEEYARTGDPGAHYNNLIVVGEPGAQLEVVFRTGLNQWQEASVNVTMRFCEAGDQYVSSAMECIACEPHYIKFDNTTGECEACMGEDGFNLLEGMDCSGGANFTVLPGYWMSSEAAEARCMQNEALDTQQKVHCVRQSIYECDNEAACTSEASLRTNIGNVVLCGACAEGYRMSWVTGKRECLICAKAGVTRWVISIVILLSLPFVLAVLVLSMSAMKRVHRKMKRALDDEKFNVMLTICSVTLGHLQVLGQQWVIFPPETLPGVYARFLQFPSIFNFDMLSWIAYECIHYTDEGSFPNTFAFYALLPLLGTLPPLYILSVFARARRGTLLNGSRRFSLHAPTDQGDARDAPEAARAHFQYRFNPLVSSSKEPPTASTNKLALLSRSFSTRPASEQVSDASMAEKPTERISDESTVEKLDEPVSDASTVEKAAEAVSDASAAEISREPVSDTSAVDPSVEHAAEGSEASQSSAAEISAESADSDAKVQANAVQNRERRGSSFSQRWHRSVTGPLVNAVMLRRFSGDQTAGENPSGGQNDAGWWEALGQALNPLAPSQLERELPLCSSSWRAKWMLRLELDAESPELMKLSSFLSLCVLFIILIHPTVTTYMFQLYNCEEIYYESGEKRWWLVLDRAMECYTDRWRMLRLCSMIVIMFYIIGLPVMLYLACHSLHDMKRVEVRGRIEYVPSSRLMGDLARPSTAFAQSLGSPPSFQPERRRTRAVTMLKPRAEVMSQYKFHVDLKEEGGDEVPVQPLWREPGHMQSGLQHPVFEALLGAHIRLFKPTHYYWGLCYEILRRVSSTSFVILVQSPMVLNAPRYDVIYAQLVSVLALMVQAQVKPYSRWQINVIQTLIIGSQALTILVITTEKYVNEMSTESVACGWILVGLQFVLFAFILYHMIRELIPWMQIYFPNTYTSLSIICAMGNVKENMRTMSNSFKGYFTSEHSSGAESRRNSTGSAI